MGIVGGTPYNIERKVAVAWIVNVLQGRDLWAHLSDNKVAHGAFEGGRRVTILKNAWSYIVEIKPSKANDTCARGVYDTVTLAVNL